MLRRALDAARLGNNEKVEGLRRLDRLTRAVEENRQPLANFSEALTHERSISSSLGGRTVFDDRSARRKTPPDPQLWLFSE